MHPRSIHSSKRTRHPFGPPDPDRRDAVDGYTSAVEEELRLLVGKGPTDVQQVGGLLDSEQVRQTLGPGTVRWVRLSHGDSPPVHTGTDDNVIANETGCGPPQSEATRAASHSEKRIG